MRFDRSPILAPSKYICKVVYGSVSQYTDFLKCMVPIPIHQQFHVRVLGPVGKGVVIPVAEDGENPDEYD